MDGFEPSIEQWADFLRPRFEAVQESRRVSGKGKWDQHDLADELGIQQSTLSKFLNGRFRNKRSFQLVLEKVIELVGLKLDDDLRRRVKYVRHHGYAAGTDCVHFGATQTLFFASVGLSGAGEGLSLDHVSVEYLPRTLLNPDAELDAMVDRTRKEWSAGLQQRPRQLDDLLTLLSSDVADAFVLPDLKEAAGLALQFGVSNYDIFYTLRVPAYGRDLLRKRLREWTPDKPMSPHLSQGVGVNICIMTGDNNVVIGHRKKDKPGPRPGQLEVGACEGLRIDDLNGGSIISGGLGNLDVRRVFQRALLEEFGLSPADISTIDLTGFGYDLEYGQWNLIGRAVTALTLDEIRSTRHSTRARDKYEVRIMDTPRGTRELFEWIYNRQEPLWSCGLVCLYFALVLRDGHDAVCTAARGLNLFRASKG